MLKKLKRKLDVRLLACMWLIFIMNYLDRVCFVPSARCGGSSVSQSPGSGVPDAGLYPKLGVKTECVQRELFIALLSFFF